LLNAGLLFFCTNFRAERGRAKIFQGDDRMAKKSSSPKTQVNIKGNVSAGRDMIYGDQYNDFRVQVAQITSPQEFVAKLQELQGQIGQVKQQPDLLPEQQETLEIVEGQVTEVIEEAQKPQPKLARIKARLDAAEGTMTSLAKSVTAAVGLGTAIAGFGQIALKLFWG
jgi:hypothetical protein